MDNIALFLNGVFEDTLTEIIDSFSSNTSSIAYLQPYSTGQIKYLRDEKPSPSKPIICYFSTTKNLKEVQYTAEIVGWEDKRELSQERISEVDREINNYQPKENGLYMENDKGQKVVNLITIRSLRALAFSIPVTNLTKVSDNKPHKIRTQAGGWSKVYALQIENYELPSYTKTQIEEIHEKEYKNSKLLDNNERNERIKSAKKYPEKIQIVSIGFRRNADVVVEVLNRAKGICELCQKPAPFIRKSDGTPYLEVHHKEPLSEDGYDTVENAIAVCPNCHKKLHFGVEDTH